MGGASYTKPKFTSFGETRLAKVFGRPSVGTRTRYNLALVIGIPLLFCLLLGIQLVSSTVPWFRGLWPYFFQTQPADRSFQTFHMLLIASSGALCLTPCRKFSGLKTTTQPSEIIAVTELVCDKAPADFGLDSSHEKASFNDIASILWHQQFRVSEANSSTRLEIIRGPRSPTRSLVLNSTTPARQAQTSRFRRVLNRTQQCWNVCRLRTIEFCRGVERWMNGSPYPFLLRPLPLALWIFFLAVVLAANSYVVYRMTTPQQLNDQNYALPWNPSFYIVTGVFIQVCYIESFDD